VERRGFFCEGGEKEREKGEKKQRERKNKYKLMALKI
jgi:hypothetical protein